MTIFAPGIWTSARIKRLTASADADAADANRFVGGVGSRCGDGQISARHRDTQVLDQFSAIARFHETVLYRRYAEGMESAKPVRSVNEDKLIQIVDAALAEAARKGGDWVVCRPGCCECCVGVFPISQSDALRLREGLRNSQPSIPNARPACPDAHADSYNPISLLIFPATRHAEFSAKTPNRKHVSRVLPSDDPCPALDPETGTCDLYAWRP